MTFSQQDGPHDGPKFQCSPTPTQCPCQAPLCLLLICLPLSNFVYMCIQLSATFMVRLSAGKKYIGSYSYLAICLTWLLSYLSVVEL